VPYALKVLVKLEWIILTLKKANSGNWYEFTKKEDKVMRFWLLDCSSPRYYTLDVVSFGVYFAT
jgi:hypothetical protein